MIERRRRRDRAGVTLIEMMVVIVIVGLVVGGMSYAAGALTRGNLRAGCTTVSAASRTAYTYAVSHNVTTRVVLDMEHGTVGIEQALGRVQLVHSGDEVTNGEATVVDPWALAKARIERPREPVEAPPSFGPITDDEGEPIQSLAPQTLKAGVRIARIYLPHEPSTRESGTGAIYFFPNGTTEHAVVQLADASDRVFSVEIHALTGRAKVHAYAFEPDTVDENGDEEDLSEVEDPG